MIELEEFVERLCKLAAHRGPRRFPRKHRDREVLIKSIRMDLDPGAGYTEPEINERLARWLAEVAPEIAIDVVALRRLLVDYGDLERRRDGSAYRLGYPPRPMAFDVEVDDLDQRATVAAYRMGRKPPRPPSGRASAASRSRASDSRGR